MFACLFSFLELHCPQGWDLYNDFCYAFRVENVSLRWTDAANTCNGLGGHLASIKDYKEMNFLQYKLTTDWFTGNLNTYIGNNSCSASVCLHVYTADGANIRLVSKRAALNRQIHPHERPKICTFCRSTRDNSFSLKHFVEISAFLKDEKKTLMIWK